MTNGAPSTPANTIVRRRTDDDVLPSLADSGKRIDAKGAVSVLRIQLPSGTDDVERLDDIARSVLSWHLADSAQIERHEPCAYVLHFKTLSQERATLRLQTVTEALSFRLREECGYDLDIGVGQFTGQPVPPRQQDAIGEYVQGLFDKLEAQELALLAQWEGKQRAARREASLTCVPVWNPQSEKTDLCRCALDLSLRTALIKEIAEQAKGNEVDDIRAEHDLMCLKKGLLVIHKSRSQRSAPDLVLPVSDATLGNSERWAEYMEQIEEAPESFRKSFILELAETGTGGAALDTIIETLGQRDVRAIVRVNWLAPISADLTHGRPWGLCVDLSGISRIQPDQERWLHGVAALAKRIGALSFATGIQTIAVGSRALDGGYSYLSGRAIHLPGPQPRPSIRLRPFQIQRNSRAA